MAKESLQAGTISEPARQTRIYGEADVVVVGGGPGGHSAAVAAARSGADTVLVERYGHLGGMPTGGLVTMLHAMTDGTREQVIAGLCQEWIDRLDDRGAAVHPKKEEAGSSDPELLRRWHSPFFVVDNRLILGARFDPEILKCILNDMAIESGVRLLLHAWGTQAIVENGTTRGIIFESKSGRQAILAKVVIDGTGDGDLFPSTGVAFDRKTDPGLRTSKPALCFEFANVDMNRNADFKKSHPEKHRELMREVSLLDGFPSYFKVTRDDIAHFNMFLTGLDILDVDDLTRIEVEVRKRMLITYDFFKKHVPGFEQSFIMITAPQIGTRGSRRLIGEYVLTEQDARAGTAFDDTIAVFGPLEGVSPQQPHLHVPYRALVPREVDGMLVAGRSFSSDIVINEHYNTISHCIAMGQAAGTAAALAVEHKLKLRDIDSRLLQDQLLAQGVPLPGLKRPDGH